jgi:predicted O-linked N-acetylglucosamine transferase (SPINDLY family)
MFDWLKRRSVQAPEGVDENARLKQLTEEADELRQAGRLTESRERYYEVLAADPGDLYATYHLVLVLEQLHELTEARRICEQGLSFDPDQVGLLARHAAICRAGNDFLSTLADYERIKEFAPDFPTIDAHLADALWHLGRGREAVDAFDRALARDPDLVSLQSDRLFNLNFFNLLDRQSLFEEHRKWGAAHEARYRDQWGRWDNDRSPDRRLRIGYVSADLRSHAVAFFIEGVLREHDRSAFEIHCFDVSPHPEDHVTARFRGYVHRWHRVGKLDDDAISNTIRAERIDILVDLSGHTGHNRLLVFARKPAPVQVTWFGYMNTTGLTAIDYRITDAYMDPPEESERFYTEKLCRIASMACFTPAPDSPSVSPLPSLTSGVFTFASVNQWTKVTEEVKDVWASILRESNNYRLLVVVRGGDKPIIREEIVREFVRRGATSAQIAVLPTVPLPDFLRLFAAIDLVLDPFPYGGGTTSLHTIWMGVPIVTLEGDSELSRACAGIVRVVGLSEFVAESPEEYRAIALRWADSTDQIAELRELLRERMRGSSLTDASALTQDLEAAYRSMWYEYCGNGATA